jgi:CTLH/CRA C-terminal to LisH motif domain
MELLNTYFPHVLPSPASLAASRPVARPTARPLSLPTVSPAPRPLRSLSTSLAPAHLLLNLEIQAFIESIRCANPSPPRASSPSLTASSSALSPSAAAAPPEIPDSPSSSTSGSTSASTAALSSALLHAQTLHSLANALPDAHERSDYLKELENVSGLLAYRDLESSPVRGYLDASRRDMLAASVNSAILCKCLPLPH